MGQFTKRKQKCLRECFIPIAVLIFIFLCGTGCSDKNINPLAPGSGQSNNEAHDSEINFSQAWMGVWTGTADYFNQDQAAEYYFIRSKMEYHYEWEHDKTCEITINSYNTNEIVFHIKESIKFSAIFTIDSDTTFNFRQNTSGYKFEAYATRIENEIIGFAGEYRYSDDGSSVVESKRVLFTCVREKQSYFSGTSQ